MPYATPQDLIARLGEREAVAISDRAKTGSSDLVELARLLAEAEDEVNGHVGRRYLLPLVGSDGQPAVTPKALVRVVVDVARYHATGTEIMPTEEIRNRYKDAVRFLEGVAKGDILLGDLRLAGSGGPAPTGGATAVRTGERMFGDLPGVL